MLPIVKITQQSITLISTEQRIGFQKLLFVSLQKKVGSSYDNSSNSSGRKNNHNIEMKFTTIRFIQHQGAIILRVQKSPDGAKKKKR